MTLEERVAAAVEEKNAALKRVWGLVAEVKSATGIAAEEQRQLLSELYGSLGPDEIREQFLGDRHAFGLGVSFKSELLALMQVKVRLSRLGIRIAPGANAKEKDRAFAAALGVPVPRTVAFGVPFEQLQVEPGTVLKPVQGCASMGVFFVNADRTLLSIKTKKEYPDLTAARTEIDRFSDRISTDQWLVEEAIVDGRGRPADDLKVFAFYGEVGAVLEVAHGAGPDGRSLFCYYDRDLRPFDPGRRGITLFEGTGVPRDVIDKARTISSASPVPFLRVDLHHGRDGGYLGEITPNPGGSHAGNLTATADRGLGDLFLDARARLWADLLRGKDFSTYFSVYGSGPVPL